MRPLTKQNQAHRLRLIILAVVVVGGLAAGRPPVFLRDCIIPEFVGVFFVNLGHALLFSRISIGVRFS